MANQGDARRRAENAYEQAKNNSSLSKEAKEALKANRDLARQADKDAKDKPRSGWF